MCLKIISWIYDTFENNFDIENGFTKCLKESLIDISPLNIFLQNIIKIVSLLLAIVSINRLRAISEMMSFFWLEIDFTK